MIASSRPLRFVALLLGAWVTMRVVQLSQVASPIAAMVPVLLDVVAPPAEAEQLLGPIVSRGSAPPTYLPEIARAWAIPALSGPEVRLSSAPAPASGPARLAFAPAEIARSDPAYTARGPIGSPVLLSVVPDAFPRFRASLWTIVRGSGAASPFAPQLGGSQAGVRATYALDDVRRFALAGRLSTALGSRQREAAIGVDWQPTALPIHLIAEQRIGIEGARGGPSIGVIAGVGPAPVAAGFRLDAYGQAAAIARDGGIDGYADGALRIARPMATVGAASIDLGLGAWGGAQRGAARFDIGPTASASVPIGGKTVRLSVDWRQRVAGDARPGSGPALSIGTDF
ncbi:hypothetical protein M0208_11910 [Sphingomonas sp. SUN019]|uniref:hypothetical protein n=1 Tax=Sphingomonas sp. SUN019 TaxID=2937788 RepID=UPI002164BD00|nr:hypothetical protein [Sphingomonas sp. SUN019]UVO51179.1 hypothetical protein M0208_11910 [Sphingomonas sp. SUN019]